MTHTVKIRRVGGALGVLLPKSVLDGLGVKEGDSLFLNQTRDGFRLVANDPEFEETMQLYRETVSRYRNALNELAK